MTRCTSCTVNTIDRYCSHEEPVCFDCCSTRPAIPTCPFHFHSMGVTAQAARAAAGLGPVVAQPPAGPLADVQPASSAAVQPPPSAAVQPLPPVAAALQNLPVDPPMPPSGPQGPPQAPFDMNTLRSLITESINAVVRPLQAEMAALRAHQNAAPPSSSPVPPLLPPPLNAPPPLPPVLDPHPPSPPPHRAAVLGGGSLADSANSLLRLFSGPDPIPSDVHEVRPQAPPTPVSSPPPRFNPLPAAMVPAAVGSAQDNAQLLTSLLTTFHKTSVKYSSLKALDQGLEEWWVKSSKSGTWTGPQLMSLANYRAFIQQLGTLHSHAKVLEYHRLFTLAINEGEHDMFQHGGHYVPHLHLKAGLLEAPQRSTSSSHRRGGKAPDSETPTAGSPARSGGRPRNPLSGTHPAGSCTNHPTSTSHTTAECKMK